MAALTEMGSPQRLIEGARHLDNRELEDLSSRLTANLVSFWEALRLCGKLAPQPHLGTLFRVNPWD
ncbi:hypothetical protein [Marinobacter vulgaris]|uniref:hypothetical protein n=1 Tax=Marinobacter vulgaris TaxID=1928331 RepID=UPI001D0DA528|nr:hypothetical protein [Marinobacter vulgaris]